MSRTFIVSVVLLLCCLTGISQKTIALDSSLRASYYVLSLTFQNDTLNISMENAEMRRVNETFKDRQQEPYVKAMVNFIQGQLDTYKNNLEQDKSALKPVVEGIKEFVRKANGVPVIWIYLAPVNPAYYKIETYTVTGGELQVSTGQDQPLK